MTIGKQDTILARRHLILGPLCACPLQWLMLTAPGGQCAAGLLDSLSVVEVFGNAGRVGERDQVPAGQ